MTEVHQEGGENYYNIFKRLTVGQVTSIPVSCLTPTQPDDGGRIPNARLIRNPIEACFDNGRILIVHGHHRYYSLPRADQTEVKKIVNPYLDF